MKGKILFYIMILVLIWNNLIGLSEYLKGCYSYKDDIICEWLVNYEGGIIRRGLTGQILYWIYQIHPYPVSDAIVCLFYVGCVLLFVLLIKIFLKKGWSLFLLPFPAFLFTFLGYRFLISRRDAWMLLLAFLVFMIYKKYVSKRSVWMLVWLNSLMVIGMLIYESIIFFIFPIVFSHFLWMRFNDNPSKCGENIAYSIIIWLPTLLMPFVILACAGTKQMTIEMMSAWIPLFTKYPMGDIFALDEVYIYEWIGQPLLEHMKGVFYEGWLSHAILCIPRWIFNIYLFIAIYYLITRMNTIDLNIYKLKRYDAVQLSNIVLIQFIFLLPYILLISDDMARNMTYWTVTSFMFFYFFSDKMLSPEWMNRISTRVQVYIHRNRFMSNPYTFIVVLLTLPLEFHGGGLKMIVPIIPIELKKVMISIFV